MGSLEDSDCFHCWIVIQSHPTHPIVTENSTANPHSSTILSSVMASTVFKTPPTFSTHAACLSTTAAGSCSFKPSFFSRVSFSTSRVPPIRCRIPHSSYDRRRVRSPSYSRTKFLSFAANEENVGVQTETQGEDPVQGSESESELELEVASERT